MANKSEAQAEQPSPKAKSLSARLLAVQALHQNMHNTQALRSVAREYLDHRTEMMVDGEKLVKPDGALFEKILSAVEDRHADIEGLISANIRKKEESQDFEPLLKAIFICGTAEILTQPIDSAIIINDYLNVTHAFFEQREVGLVNAVLDAVATALRN